MWLADNQVENSLLASMFNGTYEGSLDKDTNGRIFLDFNPYCFSRIVDCLRCLRIASPGRPVVLAGVELEMEDYVDSLIDYLGLGSIVYR